MTLGPVQLLVVGFEDPNFDGSVLAELGRLRELGAVRLVDLLVVRKDADGGIERLQISDLDEGEAEELGATVGALVGLGSGSVEAAEAGAVLGALDVAEAGGHLLNEEDFWFVEDTLPVGEAAAIALLEHRWAIGLREAISGAGGVLLADAWVHPADLIAVGLIAGEGATP